MNNPELKQAIRQNIHAFSSLPLRKAALGLFAALGYESDRTVSANSVKDFRDQFLHAAWEQIFNVELLNERFYRELANWYFWALPQVEFPADLEADDEKAPRHRPHPPAHPPHLLLVP
jgi:hypothetical protein